MLASDRLLLVRYFGDRLLGVERPFIPGHLFWRPFIGVLTSDRLLLVRYFSDRLLISDRLFMTVDE